MNVLKEKGIPLEKQIRTWNDIVKRPYNRFDVDNYSRTRQILLNGIEVEGIILNNYDCDNYIHCFPL